MARKEGDKGFSKAVQLVLEPAEVLLDKPLQSGRLREGEEWRGKGEEDDNLW